MNTDSDLIESLKSFNDCEIRAYTRFATEWRDQRLADGSPAEVAFWNSVVSLCQDERQRRTIEIRRLETMFRTGVDPQKANQDMQEFNEE